MKRWVLCFGCAGALAACGGSKGGSTDAGSTDAGLDDRVIGDRDGMDGQSLDVGTETNPGQDAAGNGCWPACIATLQAQCPHPAGGACVAQMGVGYNNYCFSTGVIERVTPTDGGLTSYAYTQTDGQTLCYSMLLDPAANPPVFRYYDRNGGFVGTVEVLMPSSAAMTDYLVDCQGGQTTVTFQQLQRPECLTAKERDCVAGQCP